MEQENRIIHGFAGFPTFTFNLKLLLLVHYLSWNELTTQLPTLFPNYVKTIGK